MTQIGVLTINLSFSLPKQYPEYLPEYLIQPSNTFQTATRRLAFYLIWEHWEKRRRLNIKVASPSTFNLSYLFKPQTSLTSLETQVRLPQKSNTFSIVLSTSQWIQVPAPYFHISICSFPKRLIPILINFWTNYELKHVKWSQHARYISISTKHNHIYFF